MCPEIETTTYGRTDSAGHARREATDQHRTARLTRSAAKPNATAGTSSITRTAIAIAVKFCTRNYLNLTQLIGSRCSSALQKKGGPLTRNAQSLMTFFPILCDIH